MGTGLINLLAGPPTPAITSGNPLPSGVAGTAYSQTMTATGGYSPYTWAITGGSLPAGLTFNSAGAVISGTPSASGSSAFVVQVTGTNGASSTGTFGIYVYPQGTPVIVTASPLPTGTIGPALQPDLLGHRGAIPYTWAVTAGALPTGIGLSSAGLLSGTPGTTGTFGFSVQVTGSDGLSSASPFVLAVPAPPVITSAGSTTGVTGASFYYQITATNSPTSYNATGLPQGLSVNTSSGIISGTLVSTGTTVATISASNVGGMATAALKIIVNVGPPVMTCALTAYPAGSGVPVQLSDYCSK